MMRGALLTSDILEDRTCGAKEKRSSFWNKLIQIIILILYERFFYIDASASAASFQDM